LRFFKHTLFSGGPPGRHCLSAVEALDGSPRATTLLGFSDRIERHEASFSRSDLSIDATGYGARAPGVVASGALPEVKLALEAPRVNAEAHAREHLVWVRVPRVLTYWTAFGELRFEGPMGPGAGLGLVEHAFGTAIPFDLGRVRTGWQWDVLRIDQGGFAAGLAVDVGRRLVGLRGALQVGDDALERSSSLALSWREDCRDAARVAPLRWDGAFRARAGLLRYEARKATPVAPEVPDGGFLGFEFEGRWQPRLGSEVAVSGTGFTEYRSRRR
jgi:hypothetical protein